MNPGQLDTSVILLKRSEQRSSSGAVETVLLEAGEPWVKLKVIPAARQIVAGAGRILSAYELTARTVDLAGLGTTYTGHSVSVLNHIHEIQSDAPYQDNPRSGYWILTVVRRNPQPSIGTT